MYLIDMYLGDMGEKSSSTINALLGLLSICPMSGYDIRQLIPETIGYFWSESYGQIYPALRHMCNAGLITKTTRRAKGKPDRNEHALTDAGREHLAEWLKLPVERRTTVRSELLLKLFFGAHVPGSVSREHVEAALEVELKQIKMFDAMATHLRKTEPNAPQLPYWLMTVSMGRHDAKGKVAWARETLSELRRIDERNQNQEKPFQAVRTQVEGKGDDA